MKLLGSTEFNGKKYTIQDVNGFHEPKDFGFKDDYYGGRVDRIAGTNEPGLFLVVEKHTVIDLLYAEPEIKYEELPFEDIDLTTYTNAELKHMLGDLGIEVPDRAVKKELIELIEGRSE